MSNSVFGKILGENGYGNILEGADMLLFQLGTSSSNTSVYCSRRMYLIADADVMSDYLAQTREGKGQWSIRTQSREVNGHFKPPLERCGHGLKSVVGIAQVGQKCFIRP